MKLSLHLLILFSSLIFASGISVGYQDKNGDNQIILVEPKVNQICNKILKNPNTIWNDDFIEHNISKTCTKTFVVNNSNITPIEIDGIKTVGELEVLEFLKKTQENENLILIDTREEEWFFFGTIPSAFNIPTTSFDQHISKDIWIDTLDELGVLIQKDNKLDFIGAKEVLLFGNGAWNNESLKAISYLIDIGYPKDKISWYRSGIQSWKMFDFPIIKQ